jgi:DNA mismatch repair protein MutS2
MYAANDPGVVNASVEFDEKTLQPTYRLMLGLAGASSGLEIARRFGINEKVIGDARAGMDMSAQEAEAYLKKLQTETRQAEDMRLALEEEREAVAMKYAGLEVEAVKKEKARQKEFEGELARVVEDFERQSTGFMKTLEDKALRNRLDKERLGRKAELNRAVMAKVNKAEPPASAGGANPGSRRASVAPAYAGGSAITVGSQVVTSFGNVGKVERMDKEVAEVLVGGLRLREKLVDLRLADEKAETRPVGSVSKVQSPRSIDGKDVAAELNLIGKTTADAEYELDRFIDEAYMASVPHVRIIHGFGTGALKNCVHHFLKDHELIDRFEFAPSNQGGNGATIAELKQ